MRERRALIEALAWQTPLVVLVLDPTAADATPEGLTTLGRRTRKILDELDAVRATPVAVRVALTHLDVTAPGFAMLFEALARAREVEARKGIGQSSGVEVRLRPAGLGAIELAESLGVLRPFLAHGLESPDLGEVVTFAGTSGPELLARLAPLLHELVGAKSGVVAPTFDGIDLVALAPGAPPVLSGDPFAVASQVLDEVEVEASRVSRRRRVVGLALGAVAASALAAPYLVQRSRFADAEASTQSFVAVATAAERGAATSAAVAAAEVSAAVATKKALEPGWPLLEHAFPDRRAAIRGALLDAIRTTYLLPVARRADAQDRTLALGIIYATSGDALGRVVAQLAPSTLARLGLPQRVLSDHLHLSTTSWTGVPQLPPITGTTDTTPQSWATFLRALTAAFGADRLTDDVLAPLVDEASRRSVLVDRAAENVSAAAITEALLARGLPVDRWLGAAVISSPGSSWVSDNGAVLAPLLALVAGSTLATPASDPTSLVQAIGALGGMVTTATTSSSTTTAKKPTKGPPIYGIALLGETFLFDTGRWQSLLRSSRAAAFIDAVLEGTDDPQRAPTLFPETQCSGGEGAAVIPGRGPSKTIPCALTKDTFARDLAPALAQLDGTLGALGLEDADRARLTEVVIEEAQAYGASYRAALLDYYGSYELACTSPDALGAAVSDLLSATSFFTQFLATVAENADLGPQPPPYLEPIGESTADFAPIVAVMVEDKGKYPTLAEYQAILTPLVPMLTSAPAGSTQAGAVLADRVSPIGRLALQLLAGGDASALVQVRRWLDVRGIPQKLRAPFLAPVECAYRLGLAEVEGVISRTWTDQIFPAASPFFIRFPFDRTSALDASAVDVQAVFGPKGTFLQIFSGVVLPVVDDQGGGRHSPKVAFPGRTVAVPRPLLDLAQFAAQLRAALWTDDGQPRALPVSVQPLPLRGPEGPTTTTLSSLRAGKSTVFGFNQTPSWRVVQATWGLQDTASVGLRTTVVGGGTGGYHSIDVGPSDWAFHRLLAQAETAASVLGTVTASWTLTTGPAPGATQTVSFTFQSDPWLPFQGAPNLQ
ncbi:hypothetical protein L6R52_05350 [Myxococcota bacterium]|nr:hypothetical protein [Myxococcota bacterium]